MEKGTKGGTEEVTEGRREGENGRKQAWRDKKGKERRRKKE